MITVLHRGGYAQMITILHRRRGGSLGTPKSDYVICARPLIEKDLAAFTKQIITDLKSDASSEMIS